MKYRRLGRSSLFPSVLGIGGLHFGVFCDQATTSLIIHRALDLGVNFIETAPMYGRGQSETFIKNAIKGRRDKVLLSTKVGLEPRILPDGSFGVSIVPLTEDRIRSSLEESLRALGTDYVDLFQVHAFDPETPIEETLQTLYTLVQEGKVRAIGCSNYNYAELMQVVDANQAREWSKFASFQVHYNIIERRAEEEIVPAYRELGMGIICNRALARGILSGQYKPNQPPPAGSRAATSHRVRRWLSEPTVRLVQALDEYARGQEWTVAQLALAWLMSRPEVSVVLAGMRNLDHLESCVTAVEWSLGEDELAEVDRIIDSIGLAAQVRALPEVFLEK